jgi:Xanthosine triphosphate pyrophosphatase
MLDELNVTLCSLNDYSNIPEILEDGQTFLDNALKKARIVSEFTGETVLADDSGLEVVFWMAVPVSFRPDMPARMPPMKRTFKSF